VQALRPALAIRGRLADDLHPACTGPAPRKGEQPMTEHRTPYDAGSNAPGSVWNVRSEAEIIGKINELRRAWREASAAEIPSLNVMRMDIASQLTALYWCLGQSRQDAIDSSEIALGGEPLDWSGSE